MGTTVPFLVAFLATLLVIFGPPVLFFYACYVWLNLNFWLGMAIGLTATMAYWYWIDWD